MSDCGAIEAISDQHAFSGSLAEGAAAALKAGTDLGCFQFRPYLNQSLAQGLVSQQEVGVSGPAAVTLPLGPCQHVGLLLRYRWAIATM